MTNKYEELREERIAIVKQAIVCNKTILLYVQVFH